MQKTIYVLEGSYRNKLIENQSFQLLKPYQPHPHKEGGYITVKVDPKDYPGATSDKIKVNVVSESQLRDSAPEQPKEESDTETVERMRKRFTKFTIKLTREIKGSFTIRLAMAKLKGLVL